MIKFNSRIMEKILRFLTLKEGFLPESEDYSQNVAKIVIKDVFGYRYEIQVKLLGRTHEDRSLHDPAIKLDFTEVLPKNG